MAGSRQPHYAFTYSAFSLNPFAGAIADGVVSLTLFEAFLARFAALFVGVVASLTPFAAFPARFAVLFAGVGASPTLFEAFPARFAALTFGVVRWRLVAYYLPGIENLAQRGYSELYYTVNVRGMAQNEHTFQEGNN